MNKVKITIRAAADFIATQTPRSRLWDVELGGFYLLALNNERGAWRVKYRDPSGASREITLGQYPALAPELARKMARQTIVDADSGVDPLQVKEEKKLEALRIKEQTLSAYLSGPYTLYQASRKGGDDTLARIRRSFSTWLDRPMSELKHSDVLAWQARKTNEGLKFATLRREYIALKGVLNHAARFKVIPANPLKDMNLEKPAMTEAEHAQSGAERRYLDPDEVLALFAGLDAYQERKRQQRDNSRAHGKAHLSDLRLVEYVDHVKPWILLMYYTGFRPGDIFGLHWEHVNFDFGFIRKTIEKTAHHHPEARTFDLSNAALSVLNTWWSQLGKPKKGHVFPSHRSESSRMDKNAMQKPWAMVRSLGNLPNELELYSLRHNFASQLVMAGADLLTVSKLMAHTDINTTIKHYGHLQPHMAKKWVNVFAGLVPQVAISISG